MSRVFTSVTELQKALKELPAEAQVEIKEASKKLAVRIASGSSQRARMMGGVGVEVAPTIRPMTSGLIGIEIGGSRRLSSGATVSDVMWGAAFGSRTYRQFSPWRKGGYFPFPVISDMEAEIMKTYGDALEVALEKM